MDFCIISEYKVETFQRLKHQNIIRLYGYSNDNPEEPCLIYQYMKYGSLDEYQKNAENYLSSHQRLKILLGVANAIDYIHSQTRIDRKGNEKAMICPCFPLIYPRYLRAPCSGIRERGICN